MVHDGYFKYTYNVKMYTGALSQCIQTLNTKQVQNISFIYDKTLSYICDLYIFNKLNNKRVMTVVFSLINISAETDRMECTVTNYPSGKRDLRSCICLVKHAL